MSRRPDPATPATGFAAATTALVMAAALVAVVLLSAWAGYAFYAPQVGELAGGGEEAAVEGLTRPRDRARVEVAAYMAGEGEDRPTLAQVIEFFALEEDTWRCTVAENYGAAAAERAPQYAQRRLPAGDEVTLCLD